MGLKGLKLLILLMAAIFLLTGDIGQNNSTIYRVSVNGYDGFHKVVVTETGESPPYENYTLNISVGDDVIWINDDINDDALTIISEEKLWKNDKAVLKYTGRQFNYTFNEIGTFTFYIKHREKLPSQIIIVSNMTPVPNETTPVPTQTVTPTLTTPLPTETDVTPIPTPSPIETDIIVPIDTEETPIPTTSSPTYVPTEIVSTPRPIVTDTVNTDTVNTDIVDDNLISTNPILMPLDILKNIKNIFFLSAVIFMLIFLIKK